MPHITAAPAPRRYLFKSTSAGVQDYLCNRLYSLSEAGIERYLLQLGQLVLTRPHSSLERVLIDLCARSLRLAVKVHIRFMQYCLPFAKYRPPDVEQQHKLCGMPQEVGLSSSRRL